MNIYKYNYINMIYIDKYIEKRKRCSEREI